MKINATDVTDGESTATFRVDVTVACPFCGGRYSIGEDDESTGVLHTIPVCPEYETLDPFTFIRRARSRIEGSS